jgi:hypothetical protein
LFDAIEVCAGVIPIGAAVFGAILEPVIRDVHRTTPKGQKPEANDLLGLVYDALDRAGIDIGIRPPTNSHGNPRDDR